jgi:hypothetical protein
MKTRILSLAAVGLLVSLPAIVRADPPPTAQIDVSFVSPENFTDFKDSSMNTDKGREYLTSEFTKHIKKVAREYLAANTRLEIKFNDINLAGEYEPQRGPNFNDVRIMKQIYPPRAVLEFRLLGADGKVIAEGSRRLIDMNFQSNSTPFDNDPLRYDKAMLTDWLRSEFHKKS